MDESVVQDMMMLADTDRDDKVSLDEFKMIMRAGPKSKPSSRPSAAPEKLMPRVTSSAWPKSGR